MTDSLNGTNPHDMNADDVNADDVNADEMNADETEPSDPERLDPTEWLASQFATQAQPILDPPVPTVPAGSSPVAPREFVSRPELVPPDSRGGGPARGSAVDPFPPALPEQLPSTDTYFANVGGQLPPVTAAIAVQPPAVPSATVEPPPVAVQEPDVAQPAAESESTPDVPSPFPWGLIPGGRFDPGQDVRPAELSGVPRQNDEGGAATPAALDPQRGVVPSTAVPGVPATDASAPDAVGPDAAAPRSPAPEAVAPDTLGPDKPIFSASIEPAFRPARRAAAPPPFGEAPQGGYPSSPPSDVDQPGLPSAPPLPPAPAPSATSRLQPWGTPGSGFPSSPPTQDVPPVPAPSLFSAPPLVPSRVDQSPLPPAVALPAFVPRDQVQVSDVPTQAYRFERTAPPDAPADPVLPVPVSAAQSAGAPLDGVPALPAPEGEEVSPADVRPRDRTEPSGFDALFGDKLLTAAPPAETAPPRGRRSARAETTPEVRQESVWPGPPVRRPEMPASTGASISSGPYPGAPDASTRAESTPALSAPDLGAPGPSSPDLGAPDPTAPTTRTRSSARPRSTTPVSTAQKVLFGVCLGVVLLLAAIVLFVLVSRPGSASPGASLGSNPAAAVVSALPSSVEEPPPTS